MSVPDTKDHQHVVSHFVSNLVITDDQAADLARIELGESHADAMVPSDVLHAREQSAHHGDAFGDEDTGGLFEALAVCRVTQAAVVVEAWVVGVHGVTNVAVAAP